MKAERPGGCGKRLQKQGRRTTETAMKKQEEALRLPQLATPFKQPRKVEHTVSPEGVKLLLVWNNHSYLVNIP